MSALPSNTLPDPDLPSAPIEGEGEGQGEYKPRFADENDSVEDGSAASTNAVLIEEKSKGVVEMEQLAERLSLKYYILLYGSFAVLAYCLSLSEWLCPGCQGMFNY